MTASEFVPKSGLQRTIFCSVFRSSRRSKCPSPACDARWAWFDRYVKGEDGRTYRESRTVVKRPVVETQVQARERTVYREQISTEYRPQTRTVYTPVTTYQWKPKMHDVLNPFKKNIGYNLVPTTRWAGRRGDHPANSCQSTVRRRWNHGRPTRRRWRRISSGE